VSVLLGRASLRSPDRGDLIEPRTRTMSIDYLYFANQKAADNIHTDKSRGDLIVLLAEVFSFSAPVIHTHFHHTFDHPPSVV